MGLKLIHSFNTRPFFINAYDVSPITRMIGNIWYYALSVAYVKSFGASIELHTDTLGKALLGSLPYDKIHLTLDSLPTDLHPRFWAAGKMWALDASGPGVIHIDGDVFLKKSSLLKDIENSTWDFIGQSFESAEWYVNEGKHIFKSVGIDLDSINGAYNTGVIGFRNPKLLREFTESYKEKALEISRKYKETLESSPYLTPDIVLEQYNVYQICEKRGANVKLIIPRGQDINEEATKIGYQHCFTQTKFSQLDKCSETLKKVSPEIYNKIEKLCQSTLRK